MKLMAALSQLFGGGGPIRRHRQADPDLVDARRRIEMLDLKLDVVERRGLERIAEARAASERRDLRNE